MNRISGRDPFDPTFRFLTDGKPLENCENNILSIFINLRWILIIFVIS